MGVFVGDERPHPLVVDRRAEAGFAQGLRDEKNNMVVGHRRGQAVRVVHGVHENNVGPPLGVPLDAGHEPAMHVLGDHRGPLCELFFALVIMDVEVRRFERGPGEGGVEFGGYRGCGEQKNGAEEEDLFQNFPHKENSATANTPVSPDGQAGYARSPERSFLTRYLPMAITARAATISTAYMTGLEGAMNLTDTGSVRIISAPILPNSAAPM